MFEKSLTDVVKGIRASKRDTALYISQCIAEIKNEIKSSDMHVKANALQKLTFLQMMGYGMSYANFATIEVMSSPRFAHKRIGYLSAIQGFTQDTDVILLTTNLLKKALRSADGSLNMSGVYETGLAINCVANIVTEELAQDLLPEITTLTAHSQAYLRKKALLCLFKLFVKYPQGLRLTFPRIHQCLEDSTNPAVVSCAVNVITELSDKNPRNYLHLAPAFFSLLTTSSNNWMLIKVVKLLGSLVPEEPRLARKLLEPLANIVRNTPAKSLLYEAVHTITLCLPYCRKSDGSMPASAPEIVTLCANTLKDFVSDKDQNLKYLGLVGFASLMQSHPKVLSAPDYRPLILECLSDDDVTIRSRALSLLPGMASRKNLMGLVSQLFQHVEMATGSYKLDLAKRIVEMCSSEKYSLIQDFQWYIDRLFQLGQIRGLEDHGPLFRDQVQNVALRVLPVRPYILQRSMETLLMKYDAGDNDESSDDDGNLLGNVDTDNGRGHRMMPAILSALAWIVGEYSDLIPQTISNGSSVVYIYNNDSEGPYHSIIQAITDPSADLESKTQQIYIQASVKIFAAATANPQTSNDELEACMHTLSLHLPVFARSTDAEVMERAMTLYVMLRSFNLLTDELPGLTKADSDDDDSDDDAGAASSGNNALANAMDGNLLGMLDPLAAVSSKPTTAAAKSNAGIFGAGGDAGGSLAQRCRSVSQVLNTLLKPAPMKPISGKAQRKKFQNPSGFQRSEVDGAVNESIFSNLIRAEKEAPVQAMESISFTKKTVHKAAVITSVSSDFMSSADVADGNLLGSQSQQQQQQYTPSTATSNTNAPASASDPFYLTAKPDEPMNAVPSSTASATTPNRLKTIALAGDDDDDDDEAGNKKSKKSKKQKKKDKKKQEMMMMMMAPAPVVAPPQAAPMAIYDSEDDDDDDDDLGLGAVGGMRSRTSSQSKEFSGLSMVDITSPLREDEVMPERKHREVPLTSAQSKKEKKQAKKEAKKMKKQSKKERKKLAATQQQEDGDLLNLGFDMTAPAPTPAVSTNSVQPPAPASMAMPAPAVATSTNPIGNAFDDLLGLPTSTPAANPMMSMAAPAPAMSMPVAAPTMQQSESSVATPWMKASVKPSQASGSPTVEWAKVLLLYRVSEISKTTSGVSVLVDIRVQNFMEAAALNNPTLKFKHDGATVMIGGTTGAVAPGAFAETARTGPFTYSKINSSMDVKGDLIVAGSSVPFKLALPMSAQLNPVAGLSMEDVATQLADASRWTSNTVKVEPTLSLLPMTAAKAAFGKFLNASEIVDGGMGDPNAGTFACSAGIDQVRVLIKIKKGTVKVDVKSTNAAVVKSISSDLKKVVL